MNVMHERSDTIINEAKKLMKLNEILKNNKEWQVELPVAIHVTRTGKNKTLHKGKKDKLSEQDTW